MVSWLPYSARRVTTNPNPFEVTSTQAYSHALSLSPSLSSLGKVCDSHSHVGLLQLIQFRIVVYRRKPGFSLSYAQPLIGSLSSLQYPDTIRNLQ